MDLPPERPSKDALYQRFHPLFDVFEKTQRNLTSHPRYEVPEHPIHYSREAERNHIQSERTWGSMRGDEQHVPQAPHDHRDREAHHPLPGPLRERDDQDRKSTRLNSSHANISYAVF